MSECLRNMRDKPSVLTSGLWSLSALTRGQCVYECVCVRARARECAAERLETLRGGGGEDPGCPRRLRLNTAQVQRE